jgi:dienelactone hydrolase
VAVRASLLLPAILALAALGGGTGASFARAPAAPPGAAQRATAAELFRDPALSHLRLSPDGSSIAGIAAKDGVRWVVSRGTQGDTVRFLAKLDEPGQGIRKLGWAGDESILVSVDMRSPWMVGTRARQTRLFVVPLWGARARYLGRSWPYHKVSQWQDEIIDWLWRDPQHVLINWWQPNQNGASARRVDVENGLLRPVVRFLPFVTRWAADHRGRVRAGWGTPPSRSGYFLYARIGPEDAFQKVIDFDPYTGKGFEFGSFSEVPSKLYVMSDDWSGRNAVYSFDLATMRLGPMVFGHPDVDVEYLETSTIDGRLLAIGYVTDRPRLHFVDEQARAEQAALDRRFPGTTNRIISRDRDELAAIVEVSGDTVPPTYYYHRRGSRRIELLADAYPELATRTLAPMKPVSFRARDGLEIPGYLTLPTGVAPHALPTIVVVHDGPAARDVWGWDPTVQLLAGRGFAVFQPNFRGSTGYGTRHREQGYGQWGLAMQDDVEDAARWLIDRGVADPARIGIYGVGYGGYAALMALVKSPELFAAGASLAGVTDLGAMLSDEAWRDTDGGSAHTVGGGWRDRTRLRETSPARHADRIRAPVLLAHGSADDAVHLRHAEAMAGALGERGARVETLLYPDEVSGVLHEENRIDFYQRLVAFFARHLAPEAPVAAGTPGAARSGP